MLQAKALTKSYAGLPAVSDMSFAVRPGEILDPLGPNGSGKSTTVKMVTGLLEPTRGQVLFAGLDIKRRAGGIAESDPELNWRKDFRSSRLSDQQKGRPGAALV